MTSGGAPIARDPEEHYNVAEWLVDRHVDGGRGGRVAIRFQGRSVTYSQLWSEVQRAQRALADMGLVPGDRIAIVANDEPEFIAWFLGAQRGGFVPVPLSTMLTARELALVIADSRAAVVAVSVEHQHRLALVAETAPDLDHIIVFGRPEPLRGNRLSVFDADDFGYAQPPVADTTVRSQAFWLYSSGTTGLAKGVMHTHNNMQVTAETYAARVLETTEDDRFFSIAKLFFAFGLGNSLTFPLAVGGTTILDPRPATPSGALETIGAERPTLFFASPGFIAGLLDVQPDPSAFESVRASVSAGESLPAELLQRFTGRFDHPILDGIGSTEALHTFISNTLTHQEPGSSGVPVPGYDIELRDEQNQVVDTVDTAGYLHVRGPSIATGYWERDEATAAAFIGGWLRTGDVYQRSSNDYWTFLGRSSDMIKAGGIWVSPAEVESVLVEHPDVLEAAVVGARDNHGLETTVAFVVAGSGHTIDQSRLVDHCRERMAAFKRPRRIIEVPELPKTATGKIQRFALRSGLRSGPTAR
ncbi:MAG: benzoate-CoA ligase family protein [Actinomycetia bacterium]|nr:benzoate-CoA ligase family protein [Actinomycetes bacterium]